MPHLAQTDHVGFTVVNLDESVLFWSLLLERNPSVRKVWNVPYLSKIHGYPDVKIEAAFFDLPGGLVLELIQYHNPPSTRASMETYTVGNAHVSFVTHDIQGVLDRLKNHAEFVSPDPVLIEWGPYKGGHAARVRDPNGITIEVVQLSVDSSGP